MYVCMHNEYNMYLLIMFNDCILYTSVNIVFIYIHPYPYIHKNVKYMR